MKTKHVVLAVIGTIVIVGAFMLVGGTNYINNFFKITVKNEALKMILAILKLYPQIIK